MKVRNDFVSNSSSCSFIIHLETQDDVDAFNDVKKELEANGATLYVGDAPATYEMSKDADAEAGDWVQVYCGEDSIENITAYEDVKSIIENSVHRFKVHQDEYAHYTFGKSIPEDLYE